MGLLSVASLLATGAETAIACWPEGAASALAASPFLSATFFGGAFSAVAFALCCALRAAASAKLVLNGLDATEVSLVFILFSSIVVVIVVITRTLPLLQAAFQTCMLLAIYDFARVLLVFHL
jgi:hypothetical protein